ncbi:hypothetical protein DOS81_00720 [Staphylococcus felis]|uniref:hypothetical protein n=1 Tax=Staphylococcus felis TaxID=46127 RepID=UPI000CD10E57|nr:hypothetical protein [Staphylococcus felis]AVP37557.1 hypothetical protein C7J90_11660 [Staphylococcus felis]PNZ31458.1 hypothetical protein CD143_11820 [Staphylococcus felis]QQB02494.1 hypothetical protein I6H71_06830 [Staphylococcus felis]REI31720.1 hypothetical protein DOS81_00720 [Staphylococcus felis]
MKLKKTFGTLVVSAVLLSTISPLVDAKENEVSKTTVNRNPQVQYVTVDGVKINRNPDLPVNPEAQNRIGATKVVKTAIKLIINNRGKAVAVVEKVGGKKAANAFNKAYSPLVKELKPMLKWSEVPANAVRDAAIRAGREAGLSKSKAHTLGVTLKEAISWLF